MQIERIMTEAVEVPPRLRAVDASKVKSLSESMDAIGLRQPITVWSQSGDQLDLVAGAHRLEAARLLGWEWISAVFLDGSDIDRQLWEIDENLIRSELTATQQAEHLAKRKELWEAREVSMRLAPKPQGGRPEGFASQTADATGVNKSTVNRAVSRAHSVSQEVRDAIRGTDLDKGVVLDELKRLPLSEQMQRVAEFKRHRPTTTEPDYIKRLFSVWGSTPEFAQEHFLDVLRQEGRI